MAIRELTADVNVISSLPDAPSAPNYTAQSLKSKFDEGNNTIKNYINDSLIPDINNTLDQVVIGKGAYRAMPTKKLLVSYAEEGYHSFSTDEYPSVNGLYDVVAIGGGGGGYEGDTVTGGAAGCVVIAENVTLSGNYTARVGAGGTQGNDGVSSALNSEDHRIIVYAGGGMCTDATRKIAFGTSNHSGNSSYGNSEGYGTGGDCYGYGKGAIGRGNDDITIKPTGHGGGGWGAESGGVGAVLIYGYTTEEI